MRNEICNTRGTLHTIIHVHVHCTATDFMVCFVLWWNGCHLFFCRQLVWLICGRRRALLWVTNAHILLPPSGGPVLIHSFTHSLNYLLIHSFTHSQTHTHTAHTNLSSFRQIIVASKLALIVCQKLLKLHYISTIFINNYNKNWNVTCDHRLDAAIHTAAADVYTN